MAAGYCWDQGSVWLSELGTCLCHDREGHLCCGRLGPDSPALGIGWKGLLCLYLLALLTQKAEAQGQRCTFHSSQAPGCGHLPGREAHLCCLVPAGTGVCESGGCECGVCMSVGCV